MALAVAMAALCIWCVPAAPEAVPGEALKALQVARGKPCNNGLVFMDGKYIPPPYVVKRYGTAIMINDIQVTAPLIPWEEFVKTQSGATVTRNENKPEEPAPEPEPEPEVEEEDDDDDPLADLFDDDPKPAKKKSAKKTIRKRRPAKPTVTTTYTLEGDFVPNEASKALLERINHARTDINTKLLRGGFFFFGSEYPRVSGEAREAKRLLSKLPDMMKRSSSGAQLLAEARQNGFSYITEPIAAGLVRNRYMYTQIERHLKGSVEDEQLNSLINGGSFR